MLKKIETKENEHQKPQKPHSELTSETSEISQDGYGYICLFYTNIPEHCCQLIP